MSVRNGRPSFRPELRNCVDPVDLCDIDLHTDSVPLRGLSGGARCR